MPIETQGLVFPLQLSNGKHVIAQGDDLIKSSLKQIISWPMFTREYEDSFGSRIHEALEDPNDEVLMDLVKTFIVGAIERWEPRIELNKLTFNRPNNERLIVDAFYFIKPLNIQDSLRYIFYTT